MNNRKHTWMIFGTTALCCLGLLMILAAGCEKKPEKQASTEAGQEKTATEFVNARCPMMENKIDPGKVTKELTRTYNGKKVAFCCTGCPTAWDKLSDTEKTVKLAKVSIK